MIKLRSAGLPDYVIRKLDYG